ncbi:MAG TPA: hypothetical protein VEC06_17410 [Paucimonas sp.]|nr:hypothetical protein [Paucimonas sp.]
MISITTETDMWGVQFLIFTVSLPNREPVFMSMEVSDYKRKHSGIVLVDSEKFLQLWRDDPYEAHADVAFGNPDTWPSDYKYAHAAKGFSYGYQNPVPLAEISHGLGNRTVRTYKFLWFGKTERKELVPYVSFTNGITRTIWLLSQGCKAFPVDCDLRYARELHRHAGLAGTGFYTLDEMTKIAPEPDSGEMLFTTQRRSETV